MKIDEVCLVIIAFLVCFYIGVYSEAKPIRVMIIDTGVSTVPLEIQSHVKEPFSEEYQDNDGHGTIIASLVVQGACSEVELISCRYLNKNNDDTLAQSKRCLRMALQKNVNYINYSSSGEEHDKEERNLFKKLGKKGVITVVAAGNNGKDLGKCKKIYPACYNTKNMFIVGGLDNKGQKSIMSNYSKLSNFRWELGEKVAAIGKNNTYEFHWGTSEATAIHTNKLLKQKCLLTIK